MKQSNGLPIDGQKLREIVKSKTELSKVAASLKVTKQAFSNWIVEDEMPPKQLANVVEILDLSDREVAAIAAPYLERLRITPQFTTEPDAGEEHEPPQEVNQ